MTSPLLHRYGTQQMGGYRARVLGLVPSLYWTLNAATGATDLSGNGRDGTGAGSITIGGNAASPTLTGPPTSTDFDGTDDRITSTYNPFASAGRTFAGWANRDATADADTLFGSTGSPRAILRISATSALAFFPTSSGTATSWAAAWPGLTQWVHWALAFDASLSTNNASLYINGALVSTQSESDDWSATPGNFEIGMNAASTDPYDGKQAHVCVFERTLALADVQILATA